MAYYFPVMSRQLSQQTRSEKCPSVINTPDMPSSVILHMNYVPLTRTLRIVYVSGSVYDYKDVPEEVYQEMKKAPSKGVYLNEKIKTRFEFEKIN